MALSGLLLLEAGIFCKISQKFNQRNVTDKRGRVCTHQRMGTRVFHPNGLHN